MQLFVESGLVMRGLSGLFSDSEICWLAAEAALMAGPQGMLRRAHERFAPIGLLASHPRLADAVNAASGVPVGIVDSTFWTSWGAGIPLTEAGRGIAAIVCLGWRGRLGVGEAILNCEPGSVLLLSREVIERVIPIETTGPVLAICYGANGKCLASPSDDCLWPSAWCVAG